MMHSAPPVAAAKVAAVARSMLTQGSRGCEHARRRFRGDFARGITQTAGRADAGPERRPGAELGDCGEDVGICDQDEPHRPGCRVERHAGGFQAAQIGDARGERDAEFLGLRAARGVIGLGADGEDRALRPFPLHLGGRGAVVGRGMHLMRSRPQRGRRSDQGRACRSAPRIGRYRFFRAKAIIRGGGVKSSPAGTQMHRHRIEADVAQAPLQVLQRPDLNSGPVRC